jgi:hypothetical protein
LVLALPYQDKVETSLVAFFVFWVPVCKIRKVSARLSGPAIEVRGLLMATSVINGDYSSLFF